MILITGASGQLGRQVVDKLSSLISTENISVLIRDKNKSGIILNEAITIKIGDYNDYSSLINAMSGIRTVLLISSNDIINRFNHHKNVIDAAKEAGVQKVVFISGLLNNIETSALKIPMDALFRTEIYLKESGLDFTILRNTLYMENIAKYIGDNVLESEIFFPAENGKVAYAQREDLAEGIAKILVSDNYLNQTITLTGDHEYSFTDIAKILTDLSGKEVLYTSPETSKYVDLLLKNGIPDALVNISLAFATAIKNGDLDFKTSALHKILGRKPKSLENYLEKTYIK